MDIAIIEIQKLYSFKCLFCFHFLNPFQPKNNSTSSNGDFNSGVSSKIATSLYPKRFKIDLLTIDCPVPPQKITLLFFIIKNLTFLKYQLRKII